MTGDFWDRWDKLHDMFDRCKTWEACPVPVAGRIAICCRWGAVQGRSLPCAQNRMSNFTPDEVRTMFTLWGIFRSPLFLGGDLPEMPPMCWRC